MSIYAYPLLFLTAIWYMTPNNSIYQKTLAMVEKFILSSGNDEHHFDSVAKELFHYQVAQNPAFRNYCQSLGVAKIESWKEYPALTTDTFKYPTPPTCLNHSEIHTTFQTSGTTGEIKGKHHFRQTALYEKSITEAWKLLKLASPSGKVFILTPPPSEAPHSSLSHMMETLRQHFYPQASYLISNDALNPTPIIQACAQDEPVILLGTALAFLNLFETIESNLSLPFGSWAMETGGYKGSGRTLSKEELYSHFQTSLGLTSEHIWNEYSMTELSSQAYTKGIGSVHRTPPWMKIRVLNPETDEDVPTGEMGYLVIYDLANIDSVCAIRTQDLAFYHDEHSFTLVGRDPSALPRGCSRSIDSALNQ